MWRGVGTLAAALLIVSPAAPALAQAPGPARFVEAVPDKNMNAMGVSAGFAVPGDQSLTNGLTLALSAEHYLSRRASIRGQLSAAWWDIANAAPNNSVSPVAFDGNFVYNWERGTWHPYATVGIGLYKYRFTENDVDSSDVKLSFNLGGGIEYFVHRHDTVTVEGLFHPLVGTADSVHASYTPWYWSVMGGFKKYF